MQALEARFAQMVKTLNIPQDGPAAIACSGGPDSMALTLLAKAHFKKITALIVDHGLRRGSAKEARRVALWLKARKINHIILTWKGRKPKRNIQEAARNARYRLLAGYCKAHKIARLLVAH